MATSKIARRLGLSLSLRLSLSSPLPLHRFCHSQPSSSRLLHNAMPALGGASFLRLASPSLSSALLKNRPPLAVLSFARFLTSTSVSCNNQRPQESSHDVKGVNIAGESHPLHPVKFAPKTPMLLGVAGAIPFLALIPPIPEYLYLPAAISSMAIEAQAAYGAVILSFLGGPHWGMAMIIPNDSPFKEGLSISTTNAQYLWSVTPSLLAWSALLMPTIPKFSVLILSFGFALGIDIQLAGRGIAPPWYLPLRALLSGIAILSLSATLLDVLTVKKEEKKSEAATI